jgi:arginase
MTQSKPIRIIGVPMDLGQDLRGVDMGPSALRYAGLADRLSALGHDVDDAGNVPVAVRGSFRPGESGLSYLDPIVETLELVYREGVKAIEDERLPIFIGGDHSVSAATIGSTTHAEPAGVLWIDAHGDFNTPETSPSGNVHGMPLAALCGHGLPQLIDLGRKGPKVRPQDVMLIGIRSLDKTERLMIRESGMGIYTMREVDERGIAEVAHEALRRLHHHGRIHVSLDIDCLDPMYAPGVGTPVPGGLTSREAHLLLEIIADDGRVASVDCVEINPILDEKNRTAEMAAGLLASLLGKSIF